MSFDLVTGGTGFIGGHVVRALLDRGRRVRCLVRRTSDRRSLAGLDVELVEGDLRDEPAVATAVAGAEVVYHVAADYRLYTRDPAELERTNVGGTDVVLRAAVRAGVPRVVYTSSVGALASGVPHGGAHEDTYVAREDLVGHYKRSKYDAERVAEAWVSRGATVVIVNPSTPVGELDRRPTPTGQMIVDLLGGRIPAYVETGLNVVDVRDVALGHLLAAERGVPGRRYILGHRNVSLREFFAACARAAGLHAPRWKIPHWLALTVAAADTALAGALGREPRVPLEGARMATRTMYFDSGRAIRELGYRPRPVEDAIRRAIEWFRENGYV